MYDRELAIEILRQIYQAAQTYETIKSNRKVAKAAKPFSNRNGRFEKTAIIFSCAILQNNLDNVTIARNARRADCFIELSVPIR